MMAPRKIGSGFLSLSMVSALVCVMAPSRAEAVDARATLSPATVSEGESVQLRIEAQLPYNTVVFDPTFEAPDFTKLGASEQGTIATYSSNEATASKTVYYTYVLSPNRKGQLNVRNIRMRTNNGEIRAPDQTLTVTADSGQGSQAQRNRAQAQRGQRGAFPGFQGFGGMPQNAREAEAYAREQQRLLRRMIIGDDDEDPRAFPGFALPGDEEEDSANPASPNYAGGGAAGGGLSAPSAPGAGRIGQLKDTDVPARFNSDFTVHAALSKRKAYVGEPIVVEYSLYDFGGLQEVNVNKWPVFTGFWKEDLEITTQFNFQQLYVGDQMARRAFIGRYAIFGIKPGKVALDKLSIQAAYRESGFNRGGFFNSSTRRGTHASQDETLEILPLPSEGKPAKFTGAVGRFALNLETDKTTLAQNTPITFTVRLSGAGNFQSIESVPVPLPPDFEIYESNTNGRGVAPIGVRRELETSKTFTYTAIPRKAGKFTVEPIVWNYFDPDLAKYVEIKTTPIELTVIEAAAGAAQGANSYLPGGGGNDPGPTGNGIRAIKATADGARAWDFSIVLKLVLGALGVLNIYLLYRFAEVKAAKFLGRFLVDPFEEAKNELADAKAAKGSDWLGHLEDALYSAMAVRLGSNPRGMPRSEQEELWREKGLPAPLYGKIAAVMDRLDRERFSAGQGKDAARSRAALQMDASALVGEMGRRK